MKNPIVTTSYMIEGLLIGAEGARGERQSSVELKLANWKACNGGC